MRVRARPPPFIKKGGGQPPPSAIETNAPGRTRLCQLRVDFAPCAFSYAVLGLGQVGDESLALEQLPQLVHREILRRDDRLG